MSTAHLVMDPNRVPAPGDPSKDRTAYMRQGALVCGHCGGSFPMPLGDATFCARVMQAFARAHRRCKAKA